MMGHPPSTITTAGGRTYNAVVEDEAFSVGGALVMPYGQLFSMVRSGASITRIANAFAVSTSMAQYRVNRTGLSRMQRRRSSASGP